MAVLVLAVILAVALAVALAVVGTVLLLVVVTGPKRELGRCSVASKVEICFSSTARLILFSEFLPA